MHTKLFSYALVTIQFSSLAVLLFFSDGPQSFGTRVLFIFGLILGLWAIAVMKFRVRILPDVSAKQQLYTKGPYAVIRHPMYTAVLLIGLSCVVRDPRPALVMTWCVLCCNLLMKLRFEEVQLKKKFSDYEQYVKTTKRLIPYLY